MKKQLSFKTNYGWISATETDRLISAIWFGKTLVNNPSSQLEKLATIINAYFGGKSINHHFQLKISGSALQKAIWTKISEIPYGTTTSYGVIAKQLGTSARYVGTVCSQNQFLLLIPCHRVIRSDGKLGGYSGAGGISTKAKLIALENSFTVK